MQQSFSNSYKAGFDAPFDFAMDPDGADTKSHGVFAPNSGIVHR